MQYASEKYVDDRRGEIVSALSEYAELEFVSGGGTGSIERSAAEWAVTEVAAGAGFYAPIRADHHRAFQPRPAAMFAMPITRASGDVAVTGARRVLPSGRPDRLEIGDTAYFRELRGGELCERFARLFLVTGTTIRDEVPTYRGEGKSFN
jgi:hypothetical protein